MGAILWVGKGEVVGVGDAVGYAESVGVGDAVGSRPPRMYFSTNTSRIEVGFGVESTLRPTPFPGASLGKNVNVGHGDDVGVGDAVGYCVTISSKIWSTGEEGVGDC